MIDLSLKLSPRNKRRIYMSLPFQTITITELVQRRRGLIKKTFSILSACHLIPINRYSFRLFFSRSRSRNSMVGFVRWSVRLLLNRVVMFKTHNSAPAHSSWYWPCSRPCSPIISFPLCILYSFILFSFSSCSFCYSFSRFLPITVF